MASRFSETWFLVHSNTHCKNNSQISKPRKLETNSWHVKERLSIINVQVTFGSRRDVDQRSAHDDQHRVTTNASHLSSYTIHAVRYNAMRAPQLSTCGRCQMEKARRSCWICMISYAGQPTSLPIELEFTMLCKFASYAASTLRKEATFFYHVLKTHCDRLFLTITNLFISLSDSSA